MEITYELIGDRDWRFSRSNGEIISESLRFCPDGSLQARSLTEQNWRIEHGQLFLLHDDIVTTRFARLQLTAGMHTRLCGVFELNPYVMITHNLDPVESPAPPRESRLNAALSLSGESDTLLVVFNSAGRYSEGLETRWEFHELAHTLGLDHVRIAETRSPTTFYTDKVMRLQAMLAGIIGDRYKSVIFAGMSSGGYASLLLSELLCVRFPTVRFRTVSINPQTGHSLRHRLFVARHIPAGLGPDLLDEYAFGLRDIPETDIATIVQRNDGGRGNIGHTIFSDSGNQAEAYYMSLVSDLPGFEVVPVDLGLPHMQSAVEIFNRRLAHDRIADLVRGGQAVSATVQPRERYPDPRTA